MTFPANTYFVREDYRDGITSDDITDDGSKSVVTHLEIYDVQREVF